MTTLQKENLKYAEYIGRQARKVRGYCDNAYYQSFKDGPNPKEAKC